MKGLISLDSQVQYKKAPLTCRTYSLAQFEVIIMPTIKSNQKLSDYVQNMCQNLSSDKHLFYSARAENKIKVLLFYLLRIEIQMQKQNQIKMQTERLKQRVQQKSQLIRKKKDETNKVKTDIDKLNQQSFFISANILKFKSNIKTQRSRGNRIQMNSQRHSFVNSSQNASSNQQYSSFCQRKIKEIKDAKTASLYKKRSLSTQCQDSQRNFIPPMPRVRYDQQMMKSLSFSTPSAQYGLSHYNHQVSQCTINPYSCIPFGGNKIDCFCNLQQCCSFNNATYFNIGNTINMKRSNPQMYAQKICHTQNNPSFNCFNQQKNYNTDFLKCKRQNSAIFQQKQSPKRNYQKQKRMQPINQNNKQSQRKSESSIADIDEKTDSNDQSEKKNSKSDNDEQMFFGSMPSILENSRLQK